MYHNPRTFNCADCDRTPALLALNGWCGTETTPVDPDTGRPGLLPLLVGDPVTTCPRGMGLGDPDVLLLAEVIPRPGRTNVLGSGDTLSLPPRYRAAVALAMNWLAVWEQTRAGR